MPKITLYILLFFACSCSLYKDADTLISETVYYDPQSGAYIFFEDDSTLFYTKSPKIKNQFLTSPRNGYKVKYHYSKSTGFRLFHIDQPSNTAMQLTFSKDKSRLHLYLGAPGDGLSYMLIKYNPENTDLIELHNIF